MSFADSYIRSVMDAGKEGQQQRVRDTVQKFGKLASAGDQSAMGEIYSVDPGGAASLETAFANRDKAQAEWDDFIQQKSADVAYSVLSEQDPTARAQRLQSGIEYMTGLTQRDQRLRPVLDKWRTLAQSGDQNAITTELSGVLDRATSYADRLKAQQPKTPEERALATVYPNDPLAQARGLLQLKSQPTYVNTPGGVIYRPGYGGGQPSAGAAPGTMPFADATGAPTAPRPLPGGATYIPVDKPPAQMTPATRASVAEKIRLGEENIRQTERLGPELSKLIKSIDDKVVEFGPYNNSTYEAQLQIGNPFGEASKGAMAYGNIKTFLSELVSGRLRLNVGPQTDSDAKRTAQEILDRFGDTNFVRGRLDYMKTLFEEDVAGRRRELQQYRINSGFDQEPVSSYGGAGGPEMPADYGQDQFAPLPEEPASTVQGPPRPIAPPQAAAPAPAARPPIGGYASAKGGPPPIPSENLGPLKRADVEAYARRYGLTVEEAFRIQMDRLQRGAK